MELLTESIPGKLINTEAKSYGINKWMHILSIVALTFIVYSNSFNNEFVVDDKPFVKNNKAIRSLNNIPTFFYSPETISSAKPEWGE